MSGIKYMCRDSETPTIQRAVKSAQELDHFQLVRGREGLHDVDHRCVYLQRYASASEAGARTAVVQ